jgi:hypothetical protein
MIGCGPTAAVTIICGQYQVSSYLGTVPIGAVIVAILFGSAIVAMMAARFLPETHLSDDAKTAVSVSIAVVGTMSALVIGLLVSIATTSFTGKSDEVTSISTNTIQLDSTLRNYGPQAQEIRTVLQQYTTAEMKDFFPAKFHQPADLENPASIAMLQTIQAKILALTPANASQTWLQSQALTQVSTLLSTRWSLGQEELTKPPFALLVLMMFWFIVIFASFGLFAPCNGTVIIAFFLSAISIGGAIRMTTELQRPFDGIVHVSSAPLAHALTVISH